MKTHAEAIAHRMDGCIDNWIELVTGIIGCTSVQAIEILHKYKANRWVVRDMTNQRYTVKHGAYLDADVLSGTL
tara:strand:- start:1675 stop:1896 length:222 start_codon:yes stop_codon:yes gene_type:complete